ncbi:cation transporter [Actinoalloteichus sp. AHMU CJ021]|uniref:Na+/H+ antiporter subunit E n=1 Tax=Actinoalloteichus sp. AHMU CJ021 TaxID=2072503 RepID=UPI000CA0224B|nr:cation transporter [Actinoalloteichus sp. AHMU CJ021]
MTRHLARILRLVGFLGYYLLELVKANVSVIRETLVPSDRLRPGIAELPLRCRTDLEITMIANLISLTPGTLTVAVRAEPPTLWVHGMFAEDREAFRAELYEMEGRMLVAMRLSAAAGALPGPGPADGPASEAGDAARRSADRSEDGDET